MDFINNLQIELSKERVEDWFEPYNVEFCHLSLRLTLYGKHVFVQVNKLPDGKEDTYNESVREHFNKFRSVIHKENDEYKNYMLKIGVSTDNFCFDGGNSNLKWFSNSQEIPVPENIEEDTSQQVNDYLSRLLQCNPGLINRTLKGFSHTSSIGRRDKNDKYRHGYGIAVFYVLGGMEKFCCDEKDSKKKEAVKNHSDNGYHTLEQKLFHKCIYTLSDNLMRNLINQQKEIKKYADAFEMIQGSFDDLTKATDAITALKMEVNTVINGSINNLWNKQFCIDSKLNGVFFIGKKEDDFIEKVFADLKCNNYELSHAHEFTDIQNLEDPNKKNFLIFCLLLFTGKSSKSILDGVQGGSSLEDQVDTKDLFSISIMTLLQKGLYELVFRIFKDGCIDVALGTKFPSLRLHAFYVPLLVTNSYTDFNITTNAEFQLVYQNPISDLPYREVLSFVTHLFFELICQKKMLTFNEIIIKTTRKGKKKYFSQIIYQLEVNKSSDFDFEVFKILLNQDQKSGGTLYDLKLNYFISQNLNIDDYFSFGLEGDIVSVALFPNMTLSEP